jgi:sugar phosphate isomerase/epimerase
MSGVHPRVCVSGISTWNNTVEEDLALYAEIGVHTVGAALRKPDVERLAGSGLRVANVIALSPFRLDDRTSFEPGRSYVRDALQLAERLGAPHVVLTTGTAGALPWDAAADALADALDPVLDGRVCIEHTNPLRVDVGFVHTLRDAIDLARRLDVGVCMELNACWAERDLAATVVDGIDRIAVVQVSDFAVGTLSTPNRLVPGDGDIPLARIIGQLLDAGYAGVFDLELIGPRIEEEGYRSALTRSIEHLNSILASTSSPSRSD